MIVFLSLVCLISMVTENGFAKPLDICSLILVRPLQKVRIPDMDLERAINAARKATPEIVTEELVQYIENKVEEARDNGILQPIKEVIDYLLTDPVLRENPGILWIVRDINWALSYSKSDSVKPFNVSKYFLEKTKNLPRVVSRPALVKVLREQGIPLASIHRLLKTFNPNEEMIIYERRGDLFSVEPARYIPDPKETILTVYDGAGFKRDRVISTIETVISWAKGKIPSGLLGLLRFNEKGDLSWEQVTEIVREALEDNRIARESKYVVSPRPFDDIKDVFAAKIQNIKGFNVKSIHMGTLKGGGPEARTLVIETEGSVFQVPIDGLNVSALFYFDSKQVNVYEAFGKDVKPQLIKIVLDYYTRYGRSDSEKALARNFLELEENLNQHGFTLKPEALSSGSIEVDSLESQKHIYLTTHPTSGPFFMDENWMTQWPEWPQGVREAFIQTFDMTFFTQSLAYRIAKEVEKVHSLGWLSRNRPGKLYVYFAHQWADIPESFKRPALNSLPEKVSKEWQKILREQSGG